MKSGGSLLDNPISDDKLLVAIGRGVIFSGTVTAVSERPAIR